MGEYEPTFMNWQADLLYTAFWFVLIVVIEQVMIFFKYFPEPKSSTRYFSLHVIVNAYAVYEYLPDVIATYSDPTVAYLGPSNANGVAAIMALHIFHIAFYRPLAMVDWVKASLWITSCHHSLHLLRSTTLSCASSCCRLHTSWHQATCLGTVPFTPAAFLV